MMDRRDHGGALAENPYCHQCCDGSGRLRPYDEVLQRLVERDFMGTNGMPRAQAEVAARNALAHLPAWQGRGR
jgi:hypothetical protein